MAQAFEVGAGVGLAAGAEVDDVVDVMAQGMAVGGGAPRLFSEYLSA